MAMLLERLSPFNVPQPVMRALRDDIIAAVLAPETQNKGRAAVMTPEASAAGDRLRQGKDIPPESARPTQI